MLFFSCFLGHHCCFPSVHYQGAGVGSGAETETHAFLWDTGISTASLNICPCSSWHSLGLFSSPSLHPAPPSSWNAPPRDLDGWSLPLLPLKNHLSKVRFSTNISALSAISWCPFLISLVCRYLAHCKVVCILHIYLAVCPLHRMCAAGWRVFVLLRADSPVNEQPVPSTYLLFKNIFWMNENPLMQP